MFHNVSKDEILLKLNTDIKSGLSSDDVSKLREEYGFNKLNEKKRKTFFQRFLDQFKDVMILILILK